MHRVRINRMETSYPGGPVSRTYVGGMRLYKQVGGTLIEDGAITTDKILANAIAAGEIAALAIEADHISANAITADKIHAGAIDSMLITGARIRTSASGRRHGAGCGGAQVLQLVGQYCSDHANVRWLDFDEGCTPPDIEGHHDRSW